MTGFQIDESLVCKVDDLERKPSVDGAIMFVGGEKIAYEGEVTKVTSPIRGPDGERVEIGKEAHMTADEAKMAIDAAAKAWGKGMGSWPTSSLASRIGVVEKYLEELSKVREKIIETLQWEICKNVAAATSEFDRTMDFVKDVIDVLKTKSVSQPALEEWTTIGGVTGKVRRGPMGVCLCVAPFNYPLNEMYAMMIPALLMGNTIVLKLPTIGGLAHILTADAIAASFPPGVINFVTGSGRETLPTIMKSGLVDMIGYIGGKKGCDALIKEHPEPHRLKVFSQLEGNNMAVVMPSADLGNAVKQVISGTTSYNGQRCTAIKLVVVHKDIADSFVEKYTEALSKLKVGLPFDGCDITPLPEESKPEYLESLVDDAVEKGAKVVYGGSKHHTLVVPTAIYPVSPEARAFNEEQFGPVIPIATFSDVDFVLDKIKNHWNGQQIAIFCNGDDPAAATFVDKTNTIFGRINLNAAPSRGPDQFPFTARRSSAMGSMSVTHAIEAFSLEVIVAYKDFEDSKKAAKYIDEHSEFFKKV